MGGMFPKNGIKEEEDLWEEKVKTRRKESD
jgi:hypothetical protein